MNLKLSVVIPVLNQVPLSRAVYKQLYGVTVGDVDFVIIDNGSVPSIRQDDFPMAKIVRNEECIGVYPTFEQGFREAKGDVVAFFHSDLAVWEVGWEDRVISAFKENRNLGMVGFIGSNEIDQAGGRGLGTTSNFQGKALSSDDGSKWYGSKGSIHGKQSDGISKAAVVDGCAMILRRTAWEEIGFRDSFPLHHFYDRLISSQLLENRWEINVVGIACDHFSGQTANQERTYHDLARAWCENNMSEPSFAKDGVGNVNWDLTMYQEAERRWLMEYRDTKHVVPVKV